MSNIVMITGALGSGIWSMAVNFVAMLEKMVGEHEVYSYKSPLRPTPDAILDEIGIKETPSGPKAVILDGLLSVAARSSRVKPTVILMEGSPLRKNELDALMSLLATGSHLRPSGRKIKGNKKNLRVIFVETLEVNGKSVCFYDAEKHDSVVRQLLSIARMRPIQEGPRIHVYKDQAAALEASQAFAIRFKGLIQPAL